MTSKRSLSPEARSIINSQVSRRALIAGAGGLGAAGLLTACGGGGASSAAPDGTVRWANWTLYLDYDSDKKVYPTLEEFTAQTKIKVKYLEDYNDNDEFYGKVQGYFYTADGKPLVRITGESKSVGRLLGDQTKVQIDKLFDAATQDLYQRMQSNSQVYDYLNGKVKGMVTLNPCATAEFLPVSKFRFNAFQ